MRFWPLRASLSESGLMFSRPMNTRSTPARAAFSIKPRILCAIVSTWAITWISRPSSSRILIRRSNIASQVWLRARLSSVMKNLCTPWATLARTNRSMSSALRARDLRPCTLIIVQKLQRKGHPRPAHDAHREIRHRFTLQAREVVHEIVKRLELAVIRRVEEFLEPSLGLPGKERDTEIHRVLQLGRDLWQHRQAAANMKAADGNWKSCGTERPGNVYRARKLIALHANQSDQPASARRSEEHTSELQSRENLVCRLLLEKKKKNKNNNITQQNKKHKT